MEREILFRGKRIEDGKWIEGFYYKMSETTYVSKEDYEKNPVPTHHYILFERMTDWGMPNQMYQAEVDPKTVCQYTGLIDKHEKKIFDGDICKYYNTEDKDGIAVIREDYAEWISGTIRQKEIMTPIFYLKCSKEWEVIGNIYDNLELLRGA